MKPSFGFYSINELEIIHKPCEIKRRYKKRKFNLTIIMWCIGHIRHHII